MSTGSTETKELKSYYFTFMQKQATNACYVRVLAADSLLARLAMNDHFGDKWAFQYEEKDFSEAIERFRLRHLITIQVGLHSKVYALMKIGGGY